VSTTPSLVQLDPLLWVLLAGALLAGTALWWVLRRHRHATPAQRRHALALLTLVLTFDLVVFGAFTRLTDSGLGCPDWPGCYASASPAGAHHEIAQAEAAIPSGAVTQRKAWIEMIHRYLATGVGGLIVLLMAWHWQAWWRQRAILPTATGACDPAPRWATLCLVWVCLQGAFGALTVTLKLYPAIVTGHLLGGIGLVALLAVQAARGHGNGGPRPTTMTIGQLPEPLRRMAMLALLLLVLQVALGGWVSTNYAVLACDEFPTCHAGQWWPVSLDFAAGFEWRRELGRTGAGQYLPMGALAAIHMAHRLGAVLVLGVLGWLSLRLWRTGPASSQQAGRLLAVLTAAQLASGLSNVVLDWPLFSALAHTAGATALVAVFSAWLAQPAQRATHSR
jgi:cytochrome c oxidase assembly protein subunit 15